GVTGVTFAGLATRVTSTPSREGVKCTTSRRIVRIDSGGSSDGVPPPKYTVSSDPSGSTCFSSAVMLATKSSAGTCLRTAIEKSQYEQRRVQNGTWMYRC